MDTAKSRVKKASAPEVERSMQSMLLKEGLLLVLLAIAIYLFLALFSYSPEDPGWSRTGDPNNIVNNVGISGAWIADVLLILFGYLSYLIPAILVYTAFILFCNRKQTKTFSWSMFVMRSVGFSLILVGAAALANMHFLTDLPQSGGGILGGALSSLTLPVLDLIGSSLLSLTFLFVGITLATGLSWISVVDTTGKLFLQIWQHTSSLIQKWSEGRKEK